MIKINIRAFNSCDLTECCNLFVEAFNGEPWNDQWTISLVLDYFQDIIQTPGFIGFVLEEENSIQGFVLGARKRWWSGDIYYLYEMCIHPTSQNKGLGSYLMDNCKKELSDDGYSAIILSTERTYLAAQFYKKHSFIESPETRFYFCGLS